MNDERFFDLAMKLISRQATDVERAELESLQAERPELRAEFARLEAEARLAKDTLPLVEAAQATTGELPGYARGRLQTKVQRTLGRPPAEQEPDRSFAFGWRWVLGLAATTAVVLLVALPRFRAPTGQVIQLAMLDTAGETRGAATNEIAILRHAWSTATFDSFTSAEALSTWEADAKVDVVKIVYDRAAAEVKVAGQWRGKSFAKTFLVEKDLATTLEQVKSFVRENGF